MFIIDSNFREDFRLLLEKTIFPGDMDEKARSEEWTRLVQYVISHIPQKLFRFSAFNEYSVSSFEQETITLVRPDEYWDGYDSLVYVNTNGVEDYIQVLSQLEVLWSIIEAFRKEKPLPDLFRKVMKQLVRISWTISWLHRTKKLRKR